MKFKRGKPCSYNHCRICGHQPKTANDEMNLDPCRWWDPDDGWKVGALCRWCADEVANDMPKPDDFAVATRATNGVADDVDTDRDPTEVLD